MAASTSPIRIFSKDPAAVTPYTVDWTRWLNSDRILSAAWTVPAGVVNSGETFSATTATIWIAGGVAGVAYACYVTIAAVGGRSDKRTIQINAVER